MMGKRKEQRPRRFHRTMDHDADRLVKSLRSNTLPTSVTVAKERLGNGFNVTEVRELVERDPRMFIQRIPRGEPNAGEWIHLHEDAAGDG